MRGDTFLLRELLENLVHNAVNYAGPVAQVTVRCGSSGPEAWIEVEDNGPGIAPEDRPSALQRFRARQGDGRHRQRPRLAIAADIANRHGGRLTCSTAPTAAACACASACPAQAPDRHRAS